MNRTAGIVVAVIGFILAIISVAGVLPGLTAAGIALLLAGALVIGLSFIERIDPEGEKGISTLSSLHMIFHSPAEVFRSFRRNPKWLAAFLIMAALSAAYNNLFVQRLTPERITNFTVDKTLEMPMLDDNARQQIELGRAEAIAQAKNPVSRIGQTISGAASSLFWYALLALFFVGIAAAFGSKLKYWQALSVAVYAYFPVNVIRTVFSSILLYAKDPDDIHPILGQQALLQDNLGIFMNPADGPVLFTLLSSIGLLGLYWVFMNAIGLKNAGENVSSTVGWTASIGIYIILILLGVSMAALFPGFIS
jgi:hypothetical protein